MRRVGQTFGFFLMTAIVGLGWSGAWKCAAQELPEAVGGVAEPLARGPIHEAFAEPVVFDPQPGLVVPKAPPPLVEELPPEERPVGEEVVWIPGYWGWDDDRGEFIWITGFWRILPPGRTWVPGYWSEASGGGYQWVSGFWSPITRSTVEYLPAPPASLEVGPSTLPPESDSVWSPGCWNWSETHYVWRAGTWLTPRSNWIWTPSHYVWTPRGYLYVDGYWDYSLANRGVLYAPVYLPPPAVTTVGYRYQPRLVIDISILTSHFFVRPQTCHYYYGDYYAPNYLRSGVYPWFAFHTGRHGYDPIYAHYRRTHSPDWDDQIRADYLHRRDHAPSRPPHSLAGLGGFPAGGPTAGGPPRDGGGSRDTGGPGRGKWDERSLVKPPSALSSRPHGTPGFERIEAGRREAMAKSADALRHASEARSHQERSPITTDRVERGRGIRPEPSIVGGQERTPDPERAAPRSRPAPSFARERPAPTDRVNSSTPPAVSANVSPSVPPTTDRPSMDRPSMDRPPANRTGRDRPWSERVTTERATPERATPDRSGPPRETPTPSITSRPRLPLASDAPRLPPRVESRPPTAREHPLSPPEARRSESRGPAPAETRRFEARSPASDPRHGGSSPRGEPRGESRHGRR